jgi:flavin-dependent dehydrogenase
MLALMPARTYDAIVVGASFAGLAVARQLPGEVLLLDRHEVGALQTSACGTPLWVLDALGVRQSVLQVHDRLTLTTARRTVCYDLSAIPFCTFDYRAFCQGLLGQTRARFLRTGALGVEDGAVLTEAGRFTAPIIVDCSGWRGTLVGRDAPSAGRGYSFGLETRAACTGDGLGFFIDRGVIPGGIGWVFPVGDATLIGVGSYLGRSRLRADLDRYLAREGTAAGLYHGTYFPNRPRAVARGNVFAVGDAAGQCLPLTAEGIRPALYFGSECGRLLRAVIEGRQTIDAALVAYRRLVEGYARAYRLLAAMEWFTARAPAVVLSLVAALAPRPPFRDRWWPRYGRFGQAGALAVPGPA